MESENSSHELDLHTLLTALPACKRCRKNRRRCDTKLESCENCTKAGVECIYYDHVLQEELPRSYVASLVDHLDRGSDASVSAPELPHTLRTIKSPESFVDKQHYFAFSQGAYRYLGAQSLLLQVDFQDESLERLPVQPDSPFPTHVTMNHGVVMPELHRYLIGHFLHSIHQFYPVLDPSLPWLSADGVVDLHSSPNEAFVLQMVYAISCRSDQDHGLFLLPLAAAAHSRALRYIEKATAESSIPTLQVAILLILYTLFDPSSSNLSQQVGFAARLAIDLTGSDPDEHSSALSTLHKIIYCLENQACSVLVRPTSLQEPGTPLTFSVEDPLEFLCTLYRIQARIRTGLLDDPTCDALLSLADDIIKGLHPNILSTLWETRLMLDATAPVATRTITAYSHDRYIPTFLTAYWVHKAGCVIIDAVPTGQGSLRSELMQSYGSCMALLGKWSSRWDVAGILLKSLQSRLKATVSDG